MIKAAAAKPPAARTKARPKKPSAAAAAKNNDDALDGENAAGGSTSAAANDAKQKPKRRRSAPKKKDTDSDGAESLRDAHDRARSGVPLGLQFLQRTQDDQRYERAPRLLPDISGVKSLSSTEISADIKHIQSALHAFEAKVTALLPPASATDGFAVDADAPSSTTLKPAPRRTRPNGVVTPEELVESLPVARRAVRITQRELLALKRERDDLERDFMRMRCTYVHHVRSMKAMTKTHRRVARVLGRDIVAIAKSLESSRRRTNALQDIMSELETRGDRIVRLTREKQQLEALLTHHAIALPDADAVYVGDRVTTSAHGPATVVHMDDKTRILTLELASGERVDVPDDDVDVLPVETTYSETERELKQRFFDTIGALVQPQGRGASGTASSRMRSGAASTDLDAVVAAMGVNVAASDDDDDDDDGDSDESDDDDDDDDDEEAPDATGDASDAAAERLDRATDAAKPPSKKRKLTMVLPSSTARLKKRSKQRQRLIEYPACTIPITPFDTGLLLSPLSTLPDRVAAVGPDALQWKDSYLPSRMHEWEQERYDALQMKGEVERLRFQLQKAEAEKLDAQQHASDQLESINQLVAQLDKLRESVSAAASATASGANGASCLHCQSSPSSLNPSANGSRKTSAATAAKATKAHANKQTSSSHKKDKRSTGENAEDPGSDREKSSSSSSSERRDDDDTKSAHDAAAADDDDDDAAESSDGASARPAARSLRPRRKPTSNSTSASPKQSK